MFASHAAAGDLKKLGVFTKPPSQAVLDAVAAEKAAKREAYLDAAGDFAINDIRATAAQSVKEWALTEASDLDDSETLADRLTAYAVGIADENMDGEVGEDEAEIINIALNAMADFLVAAGASEEDVSALINDGDADAAARVAELVKDGDSDVDAFVFDAESAASVMDSVLDGIPSGDPILDAAYKKALAIRGGKKVRINKRISGNVRLSAAQKVAIRKAGMKARSSSARVHRMKSMKLRKKTIG